MRVKRRQAKTSADPGLLFAAAERAVKDLRLFLTGELKLSAAQVEAKKGLVKEASRASFYFFAKVVLGYDKLTNETHKKWAKDFQDKLLAVSRFMRLKPRGTFKTTLYGIAGTLFIWACLSPQIRIFYTSANENLIKEVSAEIDRQIKPGGLYALVFGITRDVDAVNTWDMFNIVGSGEGKGTSLMFRTAGGGTNGLHPHVIIIDDPMDKQDRESEAVRAGKVRWFQSLRPLLVSYTLKLSNGTDVKIKKILMIATRWHLQDLVAHILEGKSRSQWDVEVESVYKDDGSLRYPELEDVGSVAELEAIENEMGPIAFSCQYKNDPVPEGTKVFDVDRLHFFDVATFDHKRGLNWAFFDPSQGGKHSDHPATVLVNLNEGRRSFFDALDHIVGLDAALTWVVRRCGEVHARGLVFETNGAMGLEEAIIAKCKEMKVSLALYPIHESANKDARIVANQPVLYRGDHLFRSDYEQAYPNAMKQVVNYPLWRYRDYPDVIEKASTWLSQNVPGEMTNTKAIVSTHAGTLTRGGKAKRHW